MLPLVAAVVHTRIELQHPPNLLPVFVFLTLGAGKIFVFLCDSSLCFLFFRVQEPDFARLLVEVFGLRVESFAEAGCANVGYGSKLRLALAAPTIILTRH